LPEVYQEIIKSAAYEANTSMMATYDALNPGALAEIKASSDITILPFPDDVMAAAEEAAFGIYDQNAADDADFKSIYDNWTKFRTAEQEWFALAETSYLDYAASKMA